MDQYISTFVYAFCIIYLSWKIYNYFRGGEDSPVVEGKLSTDDVLEWGRKDRSANSSDQDYQGSGAVLCLVFE